jgi:putative membrane protein
MRSAARALFADGLSLRMAGYVALFIAAFLLVSRVFSILWALVRLHGFGIVRTGEDLRTEYGLLTRVVQTIPRRRIQTVTIRQTPLHRLFGRASVRVATAGGTTEQRDATRREWFAPIVREAEIASLISTLVPGADLSALEWRGVHARAFGRAFRVSLIGTGVFQAIAFALLGVSSFWLLPLFAGWAALRARLYVRNLGWATTGDVVAFKTGTFVRVVTLAPLVRIQAVALLESPFDRRTAMARVRVDTAGTGGGGFHVDVPYLPRETAFGLHAELSTAAASTAFQW